MGIFEQLVCKQELSPVLKNEVCPHQFAYMEGRSTSKALIKCQHHWLNWLDKDADFVQVLSFHFSKAFDSLSQRVLRDKVKSYHTASCVITNIELWWMLLYQSSSISTDVSHRRLLLVPFYFPPW